MAKSANSKVVFVPMQLQSDIVGQMAGPSGTAAITHDGGGDASALGAAGRAGLVSNLSNI